MTVPVSFDPDATRIARIHPHTGVEVPIPVGLITPTFDEDEATIVLHSRMKPTATVSLNATEFIPSSHRKATGEITRPWSRNTATAASLRHRIRRHKKKIAAFLVVFPATIATLCFTLQSAASTPPPPELVHRNSPPLIQPDSLSIDAQPNLSEATLKDAATWLMNGEFNKARVAYRWLSQKHPDDESFQLSVIILETQEEYQ